jgi:hypothetical protein
VNFPDAIKGIMTGRRFMAVLGDGPRLIMSAGGQVQDVRNGKPRCYQGKATDYVSIDWQVIDFIAASKAQEQAA